MVKTIVGIIILMIIIAYATYNFVMLAKRGDEYVIYYERGKDNPVLASEVFSITLENEEKITCVCDLYTYETPGGYTSRAISLMNYGEDYAPVCYPYVDIHCFNCDTVEGFKENAFDFVVKHTRPTCKVEKNNNEGECL